MFRVPPVPESGLRLLSLDGGGVRGLSSLAILRSLMSGINADARPKPCKYFDSIGGASTRGLIAIVLGHLRLGVEECMDAYVGMMYRMLEKKKHRVTLVGTLHGRFNSDEVEKYVRAVLVRLGMEESTLLKEDAGVDNGEIGQAKAICRVFDCAAS